MTNEPDNKPPQIIIYETVDKEARVSVPLDGETVWLTNLQLSQLFKVSKATVSARAACRFFAIANCLHQLYPLNV